MKLVLEEAGWARDAQRMRVVPAGFSVSEIHLCGILSPIRRRRRAVVPPPFETYLAGGRLALSSIRLHPNECGNLLCVLTRVPSCQREGLAAGLGSSVSRFQTLGAGVRRQVGACAHAASLPKI